MTSDAELQCRCGAVHGRVTNASPGTTNRMVCYCVDCQAYAHRLGRANLLDPLGGSDIVQVAPRSLTFDRGADRLVGLRLSPKGLYRWYASCCNTPLGNTLGPGVPFVGILAQAFDAAGPRADDAFGKPVWMSTGKSALGGAPRGLPAMGPRHLLHVLGLVLGWRFGGKTWPHPFFNRATRAPSRPLTVLTREERDALRPLCGPRPVASV